MVAKKRTKMVTLLLALLSVIFAVCSSAITVFAQEPSLEDYVAEHNQAVVDSGILQSETLFQDVVAITDDAFALQVAQKVVELVNLRSSAANTYSDSALANMAEPKRVAELKDIRDQALALLIGSELLSSSGLTYLASYESEFNGILSQIPALIEEDAKAWEKLAVDAAKEVNAEYERLLSKTTGSNMEYTTVGAYSNAQKTALKAVLDSYIVADASGEVAFISEVAIEYVAKDVLACTNLLDQLVVEAKRALSSVAKNDIELAYQKYMDLLELQENNPTDEELKKAVTELKSLANRAKSAYENKANEEVQKEYSDEYTVLVDFLKYIDTDGGYVPVRLSTIKDAQNIITITAKYVYGSKKGQPAEVIPDNCELQIYSSANSSPKRSVTNLIKGIEEFEKQLSVAYHLTLRVIRGGYKTYELPTTDANGVSVEYEIKFDLNAYYSYYCEELGIEKDKLENITGAHDIVSALEGKSICYGYKNGEIESFEYSLEGGILMFTTSSTSYLANICVAGEGLESLFTNPFFWVIALIALILIIVIIAKIIKHVRYAIVFVTNGGSPVPNIRAAKNEYFVMPADPVKPGYVFAGWYTDKELTNRFVGTCMRKRKGFKLYAKWVTPLTSERIIEMYDELRDEMRSYKKVSFKPLIGLSEREVISAMYFNGNYIQLNLALNPEDLKKEGLPVKTSKERKFAEVPAQILISTEELFETALKLVKRALLAKGLQKNEDYVPGAPSTAEERANGFAYAITNERVASTAEDYFEMLRLDLKGYVMEEDNGMFKPGDKITLARIYVTNNVACLHLPTIKGDKALKPSRDARFEDTPVVVKILAPRDMLEAYKLINSVMTAYGLVKDPENANDLTDVIVPPTNGFAYTLVF